INVLCPMAYSHLGAGVYLRELSKKSSCFLNKAIQFF
ncbi:unnamed protein product, partial [marine sediment metagenome]